LSNVQLGVDPGDVAAEPAGDRRRPAPRRASGRQAGVRVARAVHDLLRRSPLRAVLETSAYARLRGRLTAARPADVLQVLDLFEAEGVPAWLVGGWGVDALLGEHTRPHSDVDVVISRARSTEGDEHRLIEAFERRGFAVTPDEGSPGRWLPERVILGNRAGRTVELLPVDDLDDSLVAVGTVAGRSVPCVSAEGQLVLHHGYALRAVDRHDVGRLCARFGLMAPRSATAARASNGDHR